LVTVAPQRFSEFSAPSNTKIGRKRQTAGYESERPQVVKIPQNGKIFCGILLCEILKIQFCALT
ncbi:MAG: hypothetical protein K1W31_13970, partial [Lachnospiraceae bacterium]